MAKTKILAIGALVFLVAGAISESGLVNVRELPQVSFLIPFGVVLAGMYLVVRVFEREAGVAADDQQAALKRAGIEVPRSETPARQGAIMAQ